MNASGLRDDLPQALRVVGVILGALSGLLVVAPFLLSADLLYGVFPVCAAKADGGSCMFCGMTTAFVSIGRGDWTGARTANAGSIALYGALVLNFLCACAYTMMRVKRHANH